MADTPTPGAAAELPDVADAYLVQWEREGQVWVEAHASYVPAFDQAKRHGGAVEDLYLAKNLHAPAQSQLDALREEVARLKAAAQESALQYLSDNGQWIEETGRLRAELAALKAQPTDVDALMALADEYARADVCCVLTAETADWHENNRIKEAVREALRAKLAARKEEL